jgi:hypothetical protein
MHEWLIGYGLALFSSGLAYLLLIPITMFLSRMNRVKWSWKHHYWITLVAMVISAIVRR